MDTPFDENQAEVQNAKIAYRIGEEEMCLSWPREQDQSLRKIHFYDEACGDHYLTSDSELSYRPSALVFMDQLIAATELLRAAVGDELKKYDTAPYRISGLSAGTAASVFTETIGVETTDDELDLACEVQEDAEVELAKLVQDEARLLASDPAKERARLVELADSLDLVARHFQDLSDVISPDAARTIEKQRESTETARAAAELASKADFKDEPLSGVGSATWRALWGAAEKYAQHEVYHEQKEFPDLEQSARCPLCQQKLDEDALTRLERFMTFVHDDTEKTAVECERVYKASLNTLSDLEVITVPITNALSKLEVADKDLAKALREELGVAGDAIARLRERLNQKTAEAVITFPSADWSRLSTKSAQYRDLAAKTDAAEFLKKKSEATSAKNELKDAIELNKHLVNLKKETLRLRTARSIKALHGSITTGVASKFAAALARTHVSEEVLGKFAEEAKELGLERVMLSDKGGDKGSLKLKPGLVDATLATKTVREVLSEGEQTALGLAGLLTEMHFDETNSALVLDDPITSLDHGRREKVAKRIASIASQRQVIVFTHDLTFLGDLIRAAEEEEVDLVERSIVKGRDGVPGRVLDVHPWKARDAKKRIGDLREQLAKLAKDEAALSEEEYQNRVQLWAGHLSETWERIVRNDIVGKVVERGTTEVRPRMIKLLAQISEDDNLDFQTGYSQVSKWAPRHDKSEEVNFIAPAPSEMKAELDRIDAWSKRITSYAA